MFSFLFVKKGVDWNLQSLTAPWKCRECTGSQRPQVIGKTSWPLGHRRAITVHYGADMSQSSRWHVVQMSDEHERRAVDVRFNEFFFDRILISFFVLLDFGVFATIAQALSFFVMFFIRLVWDALKGSFWIFKIAF